MGKTRMSSPRSDITTNLPVASHAGPPAEMIDGLARTAGEDNASGAELGGSIGNERHFLLVRDQQDRSSAVFQRANDVDDVSDREHVDSRRRLVQNGQFRVHRQD